MLTVQHQVRNIDLPVIRALLQQLVSGYQPSGELVDWVHLANLREVAAEPV